MVAGPGAARRQSVVARAQRGTLERIGLSGRKKGEGPGSKDAKWGERSNIALHPEWGSFPDQSRASPILGLSYEDYKENVEKEVIHGRFAMLGVSGVWAQENFGMGPWFKTGADCTLDSCTFRYLGGNLPSYKGGIIGLVVIQAVLMGVPEAYRAGWIENPLGLSSGGVYPGGANFDPLNFGMGKDRSFFKEDLDTLKVKELKHGRLAMVAFMGILAQAYSTNPEGLFDGTHGPVANFEAHFNDVAHCNVVDRSNCVYK